MEYVKSSERSASGFLPKMPTLHRLCGLTEQISQILRHPQPKVRDPLKALTRTHEIVPISNIFGNFTLSHCAVFPNPPSFTISPDSNIKKHLTFSFEVMAVFLSLTLQMACAGPCGSAGSDYVSL